MMERRYFPVPPDQADTKRSQLAAIAEENKKQAELAAKATREAELAKQRARNKQKKKKEPVARQN
jgi:hypothetical protein